MKRASRSILVVGFPGAVAKEVSVNLLSHGDTSIRLLVSKQHRKEALAFTSSQKGEISIVEGSLSRIDFGLTGVDYLDLASEISSILYCQLPLPPGTQSKEAGARTAVREIVEFGLAATKQPKVFFLSHLDVAGDAPGVFAEHDLAVGQSFSSDAQEDRYRAERVLSRFEGKLPITIIRTGWVVGHGEGLCPIAEMLLAHDDPASIPQKALNGELPYIDVGSISSIFAALVDAGLGGGNNTLHITTDGVPKLSELFEKTVSATEELVPEGYDLAAQARSYLRHGQSDFRWSAKEFLKNMGAGVRFTNARTKRLLSDNGLALPEFESTHGKLVAQAAKRITKR